MGKTPFMPLIVSDFIADTIDMDAAETGAYIMLLLAQWKRNGASLPDDMAKLQRIARCRRNWSSVWKSISRLFERDDDGIFSAKCRATFRAWVERPIPADLKAFVFERDGKVCAYCGGASGPFEIDHVFPWSRGGDHHPGNLTVACRPCNRAKGARTPQEMGWQRG